MHFGGLELSRKKKKKISCLTLVWLATYKNSVKDNLSTSKGLRESRTDQFALTKAGQACSDCQSRAQMIRTRTTKKIQKNPTWKNKNLVVQSFNQSLLKVIHIYSFDQSFSLSNFFFQSAWFMRIPHNLKMCRHTKPLKSYAQLSVAVQVVVLSENTLISFSPKHLGSVKSPDSRSSTLREYDWIKFSSSASNRCQKWS